MKYLKFCAVVGLTIATVFLGACHEEQETLNLLVWEGYADPSFVKDFEKQCNCKVVASYMGSSDELVAKLRGGSAANYDVISPSSDVANMLVKSGLVAALDLSKIPSYAQLTAKLTALPLVKGDNGSVYGAPLVWGPNPLLYDSTAFKEAPKSWAAFWDPKLKGKVSVWDDLSTVYMAAQVLGYDKGGASALYNLTDDQLQKVKEKLIALKPNIRKIWATGGELTNLFQNHEVTAAMGWPLMTTQLRHSKFPIGETIPQEKTTGWIDHLMITAASEHKELAHRFIEYMLTARTQKTLVDVTGYVPANPLTKDLLTAEQKSSLHLDNLDQYMAQIYFWENVPRRDKYNEIWNEVKAAQ
jgi:spermidine/putrescine-binding protein